MNRHHRRIWGVSPCGEPVCFRQAEGRASRKHWLTSQQMSLQSPGSMETATLGMCTDNFYGGLASSSLQFWMRYVFPQRHTGGVCFCSYSPLLGTISLIFIPNPFPNCVAESGLTTMCWGWECWISDSFTFSFFYKSFFFF